MAQGSHGTTHETHKRKSCNNCGEYSVPQLARNNYFTGKLLVERDFTDEQRYHAGKQQRHNRRLHGSGCVCGLKVKQHPNENCRDQYVVIEPGTAIDCCGRELLITQKEYFDFSAKIAEKKVDLGQSTHTLQICLRYSECATEQVPVLFDDCADGTTTQPNRIIEGYDFDVRIDPTLKRKVLDDVDLEYQQSVSIANAHRIVVDEANQRLYILTRGDASTLFVYSTDTYSAITAQTLDGHALDVALSLDGSRVYVAMRYKNSVRVYDASALGTPEALINELPAHSAPTGDVRLAVSPRDGYLYVLDAHRRTVTLWKPSINHKNEDIDDAVHGHIRVGEAPHSIVASPNGRWVLVANSGDKTISVIDATIHTHHPVTINLNNTIPTEISIADTDDGLKLYILDNTNNTVSILLLELRADPPFTSLGTPLSLPPGTPIDIAASHSGRWLYVLLAETSGKGRIQVIDAHKVERGEAYASGDWLSIGNAPCQLVLIPTRPRLYATYHGTEAEAGGVAVIHVCETTCENLFKRALHDCEDCDEDDECVVLATIKGYTANASIVDNAIDNLTDRHLLPSTDLVTDVVRCILDNGGGKGRRGEEGPQGKEGRSIEAVQAHTIDADDEARAYIEEIDEKRTLILDIPHGHRGHRGEEGPRGKEGPGIEAVRAYTIDADDEARAYIEEIDEKRTLILDIPRGRKGERGEEGPHGKTGRGIEAVQAYIVDCQDEGKAYIEEINEKRTLVLEIPRGCDGRDAELPPPTQYTRICAINWKHRGRMEREDLEDGLLIAFNRGIRFGDLNSQTFQVLLRTEDQEGFVTWRELPHRHLRGIELELAEGPNGTCNIIDRREEAYHHADSFVNGALFQLRAIPDDAFTVRVVLKGDLIQDEQGLAVDGNHLPPWLPDRPSGDGVEGGTFESWFTIEAGESEEDREIRIAREAEAARAVKEAEAAREALEARQARTRRRRGDRRDQL